MSRRTGMELLCVRCHSGYQKRLQPEYEMRLCQTTVFGGTSDCQEWLRRLSFHSTNRSKRKSAKWNTRISVSHEPLRSRMLSGKSCSETT